MTYGYSRQRLDSLARNILIGMELVDKRVDMIKGKKVKKNLTEEEELAAIRETNDFFNNSATMRKLDNLKKLIVDNSFQDRFNNLYNGVKETPLSRLNEMNMSVSFNPYDVKED